MDAVYDAAEFTSATDWREACNDLRALIKEVQDVNAGVAAQDAAAAHNVQHLEECLHTLNVLEGMLRSLQLSECYE